MSTASTIPRNIYRVETGEPEIKAGLYEKVQGIPIQWVPAYFPIQSPRSGS